MFLCCCCFIIYIVNNHILGGNISAPIDGNLYIYANGHDGNNVLNDLSIYSHNTTNIVINITKYKNQHQYNGKSMSIYGSSVKDTIHIVCGNDCSELYVECPQDSNVSSRLNNAKCIIDCRNATNNNGDSCQSMKIHTQNGTPRDVTLSYS